MSNLFDAWHYDTNIDELPFTTEQKEMVLEWYARKLIHLACAITDDDMCGKSYDPLTIEGNTAHTYMFDLEDGGRHHPFRDLQHLEAMLTDEVVKWGKRDLAEAANKEGR